MIDDGVMILDRNQVRRPLAVLPGCGDAKFIIGMEKLSVMTIVQDGVFLEKTGNFLKVITV